MIKKIAITGGIGSGKTTICQIIKEYGYSVYSCDEIYAQILHSEYYIHEIEKAFPSVLKQGEIDKKLLSNIIFSNKQERIRLNKIAHPIIMDTLLKKMNGEKDGLVFAEVPLLFENGFENLFNQTIVVIRDLNARIQAVCVRDGISTQKAMERIKAQFDYENPESLERYKKCNAILLENKGEISTLKDNIKNLLKQLS